MTRLITRLSSMSAASLCVVSLMATGCSSFSGQGVASEADRRGNHYRSSDSATLSKTPENSEAADEALDVSVEENAAPGPEASQVDPSDRMALPVATTFEDEPTKRPANADLRLYGHMPGVAADLGQLSDAASNLLQVTFTEEGADFDPIVDPTGSYVAYASTRHRESSDIYMKRVGGSAVMQLTNDPGNDMMPAFSPDGIAYTSDRNGNWDVFILDTKGTGTARQVTRTPGHDIHPTFSPDGTELVYCTFSQQSGQWELVTVNLEGTPKPKFIGHGLNPVWSPTESKILFQRARERGTRWFSIWTCDITPEGESVAFTELASSANAALITPSWSPDGQWVTFSSVLHTMEEADQNMAEQPRHADVWAMKSDGTGRTMLTGGQFANLQPVWAASGDILFISDRGKNGVDNIWSVRPNAALELATPGKAFENFATTGEQTAVAPTNTDQ